MKKKAKTAEVGPVPTVPVDPIKFERAFHDSIAEAMGKDALPVAGVKCGDDVFEMKDTPLTRMLRAFSDRYTDRVECVSATIRADQLLRLLCFDKLREFAIEFEEGKNQAIHPAMLRAAAETSLKKTGKYIHFDTEQLFKNAKKWARVMRPVEVVTESGEKLLVSPESLTTAQVEG